MIEWEVVAACQACLLLLLAGVLWAQRRRLRRQAADHVIYQNSVTRALRAEERRAATTIGDDARQIDVLRDENEALRQQRANIGATVRDLLDGDHLADPLRSGRLLDGLRCIAATLANHERTTP